MTDSKTEVQTAVGGNESDALSAHNTSIKSESHSAVEAGEQTSEIGKEGPRKSRASRQTASEAEQVEEEEEEEEEALELTDEELEALFNKNTPSFRCLAQILLSRSSLLKHPLYNFPPLQDPGIEAAFNYVEPEEPVDNVCAEKYKKLCKELNIVPLSRVIKSLPTKQLNLRYYGLTDKEFKSIAKALNLNTFVEHLSLEENFLNEQSAYYIEELLRENNTLKTLNMKECRIGPRGADNLKDGIMLTQSLKELDLSYNDLGTEGISSLVDSFKENSTIKRLNLGHNQLGMEAAPVVASIFRDNNVLEELDLSWNNLGSPQAMKILCDGLTANTTLRSLGLAWNGINQKVAVTALSKLLKKTETLECLDLSNNGIGSSICNIIKNALKKNKSIRALSLAFNVLTPENAYSLAEVMVSKTSPPNFSLLDMQNVFVKKDFVSLWRKANNLGKHITITGILGNWVIKGPNIIKLLFDRARLLAQKPKRKKMRKDFGHFILTLPEKTIKKGEFETYVKKFKMKTVDNDLLSEIIKQFPQKKQAIDCVAMKEHYLQLYPDTQLPAPKKKKGKKKKGMGKEELTTTDTLTTTARSFTTTTSAMDSASAPAPLSSSKLPALPQELEDQKAPVEEQHEEASESVGFSVKESSPESSFADEVESRRQLDIASLGFSEVIPNEENQLPTIEEGVEVASEENN